MAQNILYLSPDESMQSLSALRVYQQNGAGQWILLWQGSAAQADGTSHMTVNGRAPVDTAMAYNAFGEVTAKSVDGQAGEYFDYDSAERLWITSAGAGEDAGVDKIYLYDTEGRRSAEASTPPGNGWSGTRPHPAKRSCFGSAQAQWGAAAMQCNAMHSSHRTGRPFKLALKLTRNSKRHVPPTTCPTIQAHPPLQKSVQLPPLIQPIKPSSVKHCEHRR